MEAKIINKENWLNGKGLNQEQSFSSGQANKIRTREISSGGGLQTQEPSRYQPHNMRILCGHCGEAPVSASAGGFGGRNFSLCTLKVYLGWSVTRRAALSLIC